MKREDLDFVYIEKLSERGLNKSQIAYSLGISRSTFYRWWDEDPKIKISFEKGRVKAIEEVSSRAFQMAISGKHPSMTMFWLKCNAGWNEKDNQQSRILIDVQELNL